MDSRGLEPDERRSTLETDSQRLIHTETDSQHGGTAATPPPTKATKAGGKKPASAGNASKQKSTIKGTEHTALEEEQRKAAAAQAAVEDLQQRLAAVESALAEERQKAAAAQQALAEQRSAAETHPETSERAAEQLPGGEAAFGLMPLTGFSGAEIFNVSRQVFEQAVKQPPLVLKHYTNFLMEMGRVVTGQSTVEPGAKDKRLTDEVWKTNPFYRALLQSYLTWQQSLGAFIDDADLGKKDAERARFVLSLYVDAVAPSNTLLGNPAAMKKMYETGGASLVKGLTHMLEDLANNGGLPSQVDMKAFDAVRAITGSQDVNILGACLGGMTLATLLGHLAARGDRRIHAVTFLVTVLDSNVESTMGLFATKETIEAARQVSRLRGVIEGQEMARAFAWLRPNDLIWNYWVNNYLVGNDPAAFDVLYWNNDTTRLPARLHEDLLGVLETNAFAHPGTLTVLETPIDLSRVTNDAYIIAGITDHITPWQGCYATTQLLGGEVKFILSNSGHIQAILNPPGNPKASYFVNERYPADPEHWLARAQKRAGSWWEDWRDWLGQRSGEQKAAPQELGSEQYEPGTPAPGSYVFEP